MGSAVLPISSEDDIVNAHNKYRETEGTNRDKAKGIVAKPMPRYWHDRHSVNLIEDQDEKRFQLSIVADKKPYFMRIIYPALAKQYNTYIKTANKNAVREFGIPIDEIEQIPVDKRSDRQNDFLRYFHTRMPVGTGDCVMNKICRRFESEFDGYLRRRSTNVGFDVSRLKSDAQYTHSEYKNILKLYETYSRRVKEYAVYATIERIDDVELASMYLELGNEFVQQCNIVCPNKDVLCSVILDVCYTKNSTKRFAWDMCGDEIIRNLLRNNGNVMKYPSADACGDIEFSGKRFSVVERQVEEVNGDCVE